MSERHPIISITGSPGAGTTSVTRTFENIFRREGVRATLIEGESFHRFDRQEMKRSAAEAAGNPNFSHFGPESKMFSDLEDLVRSYGEMGPPRAANTCTMTRKQPPTSSNPAPSHRSRNCKAIPTSCSTKGCMAV